MSKTMTVGQLIESLTAKISAGEITQNTLIAMDGMMEIGDISIIETYDGNSFVLLDTYDPALDANVEATA